MEQKTMMTILSEDSYYDIIDSSGCSLVVFGERGEQWTEEVLGFFKGEEVPVHFLPWGEIPELRLQLEMVSYPAVQLWDSGSLRAELSGYHCESLKNLIQSM